MTRMMRTTVVTALAGLMVTTPAMAGGFSLGFGYSKHGHRGRGWGFGLEINRPTYVVPAPVTVVPAPVVIAPPPPVWVPPVYQTVAERVWVPTVQTLYRTVTVRDAWGRVLSYRQEPYTVRSGYWTEVRKQVLVREGYWAAGGAPIAGSPVYPQGEAGEPGYASPAPGPQQAPGYDSGEAGDDGAVMYRSQRTQKSIRASHSVVE